MPLPVKAAAAEALPPSSAGDGGGLFTELPNPCGKAVSYPLPPA